MGNIGVLKMFVGALLSVGSYASTGVTENDYLRVDGYVISMGGKMDFSFVDSSVIVASDSSYYELKKEMVVTPRPELLDQIGARVELTIPVGGVLRAWSIVDKSEDAQQSLIPHRLH